MKKIATLLVATLLLGLAPAVTAAEPPPPIDWGQYYTLLPKLKEIAEASEQSIYRIHDLVTRIEQAKSDAEAEKVRLELRDVLEKHRQLKLDQIALVDKILKFPKPTHTDKEALKIFRYTNLRNVSWNDQFLKYVVRDLSQATGIPMRLQRSVQELNQVAIHFPEVTAESALNLICQNFDLKWIIFGGEIIIYRAINRNEERFLEYEKKHGKVDWIAEDKKSTYETLPTEEAKRELKKVENMDLPFLKGNLTKLYILEGESQLHEVRLKELEMASKFAENLKENLGQTDEEKKADVKRHKHIVHYMYMERDNAVEVWNILNQVLGIRLTLDEDNEEAQLRALLNKEIDRIEWRNRDTVEALQELGKMVGVPVQVDLPPFMELQITLSVENVTLETVLGLIQANQPLEWRYVNGKLFFAHVAGK